LKDHARVIVGHMTSYLVCDVPLYVVLFLELLLDPQEEFVPVHSRFSAPEEVVEPPEPLTNRHGVRQLHTVGESDLILHAEAQA